MSAPAPDWQADAAADRVRRAFARLCDAAEPAAGGAALAIWQDGRTVLSLHAGSAAPDRPWTTTTPCLIWSASKGIAAACALHALAARGIPLHAPVADCWPEFAAAGKGDITLADLLSHRAGLAAIDQAGLAITDHSGVAAALAAQPRNWPADGSHGYGARTFGFLVDEVVRRVSGEPLAAYWDRVFRGPLRLDLWFGLPADRIDDAAVVIAPRTPPPPGPFARAFATRASLTRRALTEPGGLLAPSLMNTPALRSAALPSLGAIATADALARFYSLLAGGGMFSTATVATMATSLVSGEDRVLIDPTSFSAGFMTNDHGVYGGCGAAFGHPGAGGAIAFAVPALGIGFAFVPSAMHPGALPGPRTRALVAAAFPPA